MGPIRYRTGGRLSRLSQVGMGCKHTAGLLLFCFHLTFATVLLSTFVFQQGQCVDVYLPGVLSSGSGSTLPQRRFDKVCGEWPNTRKRYEIILTLEGYKSKVKSLGNDEDRSRLLELHSRLLSRSGNDTCTSCKFIKTILSYDFFNVLELGVGNCQLVSENSFLCYLTAMTKREDRTNTGRKK